MANIIPLPQSQFNPMGTGAASRSNPLAGSIDALFNAYKLAQQTKLDNATIDQMGAQTQGLNLANTGTAFQQQAALNDYRASHGLQSPAQLGVGYDQLQQGSFNAPAPSPDGGPQSGYSAPGQSVQSTSINQPSPVSNQPPVPGMPTMAPAPQQPQGQPARGPGLFGHADTPAAQAALNQVMYAQAGQQLGAANAYAGLGKTQAESAEAAEKARGAKILNDMLAGDAQNPGGVVDQHIKNMQAGNEDPSMSSFGRGDTANAIRTAVSTEIARRGLNVTDLKAAYDAKQAAASSKASSTAKVQGGDTQEIGTIAGVVSDTIDSLKPLIASLNTNQVSAINSAFLQGKKALNDPKATAALTKLNILTNRQAVISAYPNAPTAQQFDDIRKLVSSGLTSGSLDAMGDSFKEEGNSIVKRAGGAGYDQPNPNPTEKQIKIGKYSVTFH